MPGIVPESKHERESSRYVARMRRSFGTVRVLLLVAVLLVVAACSSETDQGTRTTEPASTSGTGAKPTSSVETTSAPSKSAVTTDDPSWSANATALRGQNGTTHQQACPPNPSEAGGSVWGAGTYTDDSSICTAAVQSGLITFADGGDVTFEIAPGIDSYRGGVANGVTSDRYGPWEGSFTFPDAPPGSVDFGADVQSWARNATTEKGPDGTRVTIECSPDGQLGSIWGSGPYTSDSSICTAGVHSGVIDAATGGTVTVELAPGRDSYDGSTANGVTSSEYGRYDRSFIIVEP